MANSLEPKISSPFSAYPIKLGKLVSHHQLNLWNSRVLAAWHINCVCLRKHSPSTAYVTFNFYGYVIKTILVFMVWHGLVRSDKNITLEVADNMVRYTARTIEYYSDYGLVAINKSTGCVILFSDQLSGDIECLSLLKTAKSELNALSSMLLDAGMIRISIEGRPK